MAIIQQIENGKLVDSSASNTSLSTENKSDATGGALDKDAFLQLLVAQMQYQDPLEPTDNTEYISQLATFSQLEEMQNLNQSLTEGSAYNLVGKYVFVKVTNNQTPPIITTSRIMTIIILRSRYGRVCDERERKSIYFC